MIPPSCLELPLLSSYDSKQLERVSASEVATPTPADSYARYAVSDTPLPADRCSYWAAVIKANACSIFVGVIADKGVEHCYGHCNIDQLSWCGISVRYDGKRTGLTTNGRDSYNDAMASAAGDVLLFRLDPLQRRLRIINSRTRQATDMTEVARGDRGKPLFITINMNADSSVGPVTQMALRQVTAAERAILE
jgi:hypothetical protein